MRDRASDVPPPSDHAAPVKKALLIALYILGGICASLAALALVGMWALGRDQFHATKNDLPSYVAGRWDWSTRGQPCGDSAHVISFAPDGRTMSITQEGVPDSLARTIYDLLAVTPSRIRGAIRGETRQTAGGVPVVWDLVMFSPREYRWHRADWSRWGFTPEIVRCDARTADAARPDTSRLGAR